MNKTFQWKLGLIVATLLVFAYGIFGIPQSFSGEGLLAAMHKRINLGLDLRGGTHLILQVQVNDAVNADSDRAIERLKDILRDAKIAYTDVSKPDPQNSPEKIVIKGITPDGATALRNGVSDKMQEYDLASGAENTWVLAMKPTLLSDLKKHAVTQAIETIRGRVDTLGVSEPVIQEHGLGEYQILVQLPGVDDPERVKAIIQSTAMLEIKQVLGGPYGSEQAALAANNGLLPPNGMLLKGKTAAGQAGDVWYLVTRSSAVTGNDLRDAQAGQDRNGGPNVNFYLTNDGGKRFQSFTSSHIGENLGVVLDSGSGARVEEVAVIRDTISDQGEISGTFTAQQTQDLAMTLRSGALPAGIHYLEERTVGPSLGADSIRAGVRAAIIGMLAVMIFMLVYYRGAGINADLALILNLLILLGFLGFSQATLTLPGIAGVILTIGMGVDSNVLIFERIREELRAGRTSAAAVEEGFKRAWVTIVDTHVTTVVSAGILFIFGTGPVKGFAITLIFGLLANLFTAVFVSRVIFDWILSKKDRGEALSI
jgi:preprotein translocase subunit SecD